MEIDIKGYKVLIDDEDYERMRKHGWCVRVMSQHMIYFRSNISGFGKGRISMLHRFIVGCVPNDGKTVDHINGNTLDNRKCNLRICTQHENSRNQRIRKNNTTGYKGVRIRRQYTHTWDAYIMVDNKQISLGVWDNIEDAAHAYDIAALYYFGEFARLNFSPENYLGMDIIGEYNKVTQTVFRRNGIKRT